MRRLHPELGTTEDLEPPRSRRGMEPLPDRSSIYRALVRHQLDRSRPQASAGRATTSAGSAPGRWSSGRWTSLSGVHLADGTRPLVVTDIDDHSRFCVCAAVVARATAKPVCDALLGAMEAHGVPEAILSDIQADCALGSTVRPAGGGMLRGERCPLGIAADRSERLTTPCLLGVSRAGATPGKERPVRYSVTGPGRIPVGECPARPPRWRHPSVLTRILSLAVPRVGSAIAFPASSSPDSSRSLVLLADVFVASFALNVVWTNQGSAWGFFSLPTRAWEFAAGGFLGSLAIQRPFNSFIPKATGFFGLALPIVSTELFDSNTTSPGVNALVPVAGTALLILGGTGSGELRASSLSRVLSVRWMQWIGRLSYSWHRWHWPFIVLTVLAAEFRTAFRFQLCRTRLARSGISGISLRRESNPLLEAHHTVRILDVCRRTSYHRRGSWRRQRHLGYLIRRDPYIIQRSVSGSRQVFSSPM